MSSMLESFLRSCEPSIRDVYFVVDEQRELLTIVDVWNGQRGRPPKL